MRLMHISDLHLGKRIHEVSMIEDQAYILKEILRIAIEQKVDGIMIAGDIYDKSIPPASAVELFDEFLVSLAAENFKIFLISGNHDSPERIAFGGRLMEEKGVYISPVFQKNIPPVVLEDEVGELYIYMLPFVKPAHVREAFPEENVESYTQAIEVAVNNMNVDPSRRNILITHQFVTGATRSDSEDISVGGSDNVNSEVFKVFDYVALGHLHGPQSVSRESIRYSGTPLKYSFSESHHTKSVTIVEMKNKEDGVEITPVALHPLRDMNRIKGLFDHVTKVENYERYEQESYVHVTLTDEEEITEAMTKLRYVFPNIMKMDYDNTRTRKNQLVEIETNVEEKSPLDLVAGLYQKQNNSELKEQQIDYLEKVIEQIWRAEG